MICLDADIVIIGSGAGGGTVARSLAPLARDGMRVLLLEQGARLDDHEFTGREIEMADALRGIRQFTVGTGGANLYEFTTVLPNSEVRDNSTHGVLALALGDGRYGWSFFPAAGGTFRDYGTGACH